VLTTFKETQWLWRGEDRNPEDFRVEPPAKNSVDNMVRAINEDFPIMVTGEEGRNSVELVEAIHKSAKSGKVVKL